LPDGAHISLNAERLAIFAEMPSITARIVIYGEKRIESTIGIGC